MAAQTANLDFTAWKFLAVTDQHSRCEGTACYAREFIGSDGKACGVMALATGAGPEGLGAQAANAVISSLAAELRQEGRFEDFRQSWYFGLTALLTKWNDQLQEAGKSLDAPILVSACFALTEPQDDGFKLSLLTTGSTVCYYGSGSSIQRCNHLDTDGKNSPRL